MNLINYLSDGTINLSVIRQISEVAGLLHRLKWAPSHAGNFSLRLGQVLLTKISGARMQQIYHNPLPYLCLVYPAHTGCRFTVKPADALPTEEICAHILSQRIIARYRPQEKWILHSHPGAIIRFSLEHTPVTVESVLKRQRALAVSAIPFFPAGSKQLARATAKAFRYARVIIWCGHGAIASGKSLHTAFERIKTVNEQIRKVAASGK
ncbi:MAG: class II aldolase/adducin family protein [candidate division WOR-3 bacterium]